MPTPSALGSWEPFSKEIEAKQRDVDHVSFFVDGQVFEELTPLTIAKHNCLHMINVIDKLTKYVDRDLDAATDEESVRLETILAKEVVPDLLVYAVQIATAFKIDWLISYGQLLPPEAFAELQEVSRLADILHLQSKMDAGQAAMPPDRQWRSVRKFIVEASSFLARICDKDDHGTVLPKDELGRKVTNVLLRECLRMARMLHVNLDRAYEERIGDIKRKYGNVRVLLGKA
jgi:hypothetical protein